MWDTRILQVCYSDEGRTRTRQACGRVRREARSAVQLLLDHGRDCSGAGRDVEPNYGSIRADEINRGAVRRVVADGAMSRVRRVGEQPNYYHNVTNDFLLDGMGASPGSPAEARGTGVGVLDRVVAILD